MPPKFLDEAAPAQLEEAVAANHREWMIVKTLAAGGSVHETDGVAWTYAGPEEDANILFPRLSDESAGATLDRIADFYRERAPRPLVGCWSLSPPRPADLDSRLLARGFQPGWNPCWMWLDTRRLKADVSLPPGVTVGEAESITGWVVEDLPYYSHAGAAARQAAADLAPRRVWSFAAWHEGRPVAQSALCVTRGPLGAGGIFDVGVVPAMRGQGIGRAVTVAACRKAAELGCRHVLLNGTGERMYRQIGFERLGFGRTWWLNARRLAANPPSLEHVALVEAIGRSDCEQLTSLRRRFPSLEVSAPLTNGMTPLDVAVETRQPEAARWLEEQGVALGLFALWDLGWKERVAELIARRPEAVNEPSGELLMTPLHEAVQRDDIELARLLLDAGADLTAEDARFHSTPLGWAMHLGRSGIAALIEESQAGSE
jgi:GNAT superfamily N-acetyltransferase